MLIPYSCKCLCCFNNFSLEVLDQLIVLCISMNRTNTNRQITEDNISLKATQSKPPPPPKKKTHTHTHQFTIPPSLTTSLTVKLINKPPMIKMYLKRNKATCRISIFGGREAIRKYDGPMIIQPPTKVYMKRNKKICRIPLFQKP